MMLMPWGKHKGRPIERLPSGYLRWLAENMDESRPTSRAICLAADKEWQHRERTGTHFEDEDRHAEDDRRVRCPHCGGRFTP